MPPTLLSTIHAISHLTSQNLWLKHYYYLQITDEETKALRGLTWEERYSYWGMVEIWNHGFLPSEPKLSTLSYYGRILIFFNWNIVDFCFRCTAKWFSYIYLYRYSYIYAFSCSFPLQFITRYWVYFPMLYSRFLLCIFFTYSSVYLLFPNSQFIPPFLPSLVTISLFSMIGDYFCFVYKFMCHFFFLDSTYKWNHRHLSFSAWLHLVW